VRLRLGPRVVEVEPGRPLVMGIVNAGPDSFSDRTRTTTLAAQLERARALVADGADLIDVGAESGVTWSPPSSPEVERSRVVPLVEALAAEGVAVSVDTFKPAVAEVAVAAGAVMVNDVSGLADLALADVAAASGAALVVMHTRAAPKEERFADFGGDVGGDVERFLRERSAMALGRGVGEDQLVLDPGPDFAKTPAETVAVLRDLERLRTLGRPLLLALSRKFFLGAVTGRAPDERLAATLAAVAWAVDAGAGLLRVHDVREVRDVLAVKAVLDGHAEVPDVDLADEQLKWLRPLGDR
jgi:dihydropteroate synthase